MIDEAHTNWLVRHDADDIAYPDRLATVVRYINRYPEVGAFYSEADFFHGNMNLGRFRTTAGSPVMIRSYTNAGYLLSICHPAVTLSKEKALSVGKYREIPYVEDIDLWARLSLKHEMVYMSEVGLKVRLHDQSISSKNLEEQALLAAYVQYLLISNLWGRKPAPLEAIRNVLSKMFDAKKFHSKAQIRSAGMKVAQRDYTGAFVAGMRAVLASPRFTLDRITMNVIRREKAAVNGIDPLQFANFADDLWPADTGG
jgi:glycosyltransferase involved in cell wall biosynthesis